MIAIRCIDLLLCRKVQNSSAKAQGTDFQSIKPSFSNDHESFINGLDRGRWRFWFD